jgi:aldose 1-epimerase
MPLAAGFHPFFRLHDAPRPEWRVHIAARTQYVLDARMIPTGETTPAPYGDPHVLGKVGLDDELTDLVRGADGRASFWVQGKRERITVEFGPKYPVATVFTPPDKEAVCFEPMSAITNAFNLAQRGIYKGLQSIPPGGEWQESFWVKPAGFAPGH